VSATQADKAERFLRMHRRGEPLLMPNAWDAGSAGILAWLGFQALATTSSGHAATLGRLDGGVTREETLAHAADLSRATELPVSADLENAFADEPDGVAETIGLARESGLAGCSVEDYSGRADDPIYDRGLARERIVAAAEIAHSGPVRLVLTARAENFIRGRKDLGDTIERLQAYQEAGADVLFAPGLSTAHDIRHAVESVDRPVSVLALRGVPSIPELAALGVARVSVGGAFAFAALGGLREAAEELRDRGTYEYLERTALGSQAARAAFKRPPAGSA
jgi:2-methylisocitrate lyase-like PEP mutase family enzyme